MSGITKAEHTLHNKEAFLLKLCKSKPLINSYSAKPFQAAHRENIHISSMPNSATCWSRWPVTLCTTADTISHPPSSQHGPTALRSKGGLECLSSPPECYKTFTLALLNRHMGRNRYMSDLNITQVEQQLQIKQIISTAEKEDVRGSWHAWVNHAERLWWYLQ